MNNHNVSQYNHKYYLRGKVDIILIDLLTWVNLNIFKKNFRKNNLLLEVGCGDGQMSKWLSKTGLKIDAVDISKDAIDIAKKQSNLVNYVCGDVFSLKRKDDYYNAVYSLHVMEHIENIEDNLKEIYRIIKRGGKFVIRIPNSDSVEAKLAGENWFHWDEPYHKHHWSAEEFKKLLINVGFMNVNVNFKTLEYKQVLLYSCLNKLGIKTDKISTRLYLLPFQVIFVPISLILGFVLNNSGTVELVAIKKGLVKIVQG